MVDEYDFRVLGPLEIRCGATEIHLPPIRRRLLAVLLAQAGNQVTDGELADSLWAGAPPPSTTKSLQIHVHRLRRSLGDSGHLSRGPAGYRIDVATEELDALRFTDMVERARRERAADRQDSATSTLEQALALWRGEPYAGIDPTYLIAAEADRLTELRLSAWQALFELRLDAGERDRVIAPLSELADRYPHFERFSVLLVLALYRAGRQTQALEEYRIHRDRLVDEFGIEPCEAMQRVHRAVLRADDRLADVATESLDGDWEQLAPSRVRGGTVPKELPLAPHYFTGRKDELARLDDLIGDEAEARPIAVITGMGGVGKTALALQWAHREAARFPDGHLYLDLRGDREATALRPIDALTAVLGSLGVPAEHAPSDLDIAAARLRTLTVGRRLLIVLDNTAAADQIVPLLPAGPGCAVLVTSRHRLTDLIASHGAERIALGPFSTEEAQELVTDLLDQADTRFDETEIATLAEQCGRLPLALRIAAAKLTEGAGSDLASYAARSSCDHPTDPHRFDLGEDGAIRAAFESSYNGIPTEAKHLFCLLSLVPGADFTVEAAASLVDGSREVTEFVLDRLVMAHLVDRYRPDRYRLHDLLREYGEERAAADETPQRRTEAIDRLLHWYFRRADACHTRLYPAFARLPAPDGAGTPPESTHAEAAGWLDAELGNLIAAIQLAAERAHPTAWHIDDALRGYLWLSQRGTDCLLTGRAALDAATRAGDTAGQASAELSIATALIRCNQSAEAVGHGERAAELAQAADWTSGHVTADHYLAFAFTSMGRLPDALARGMSALRNDRRTDRLDLRCLSLETLGVIHYHLGELDRAIEFFEEELETAEKIDGYPFEASLLAKLARANYLRGRLHTADTYMRELFELRHRDATIGQQYSGYFALAAHLHLARGRVDEATTSATLALDNLGDFSDRRLEADSLCAMAAVRIASGRYREAIDDYDRVFELSRSDPVYYRIRSLLGKAEAQSRLGLSDDACVAVTLGLKEARSGGFRIFEAQALNLRAEINLDRGSTGEAADSAANALRIGRETGHRLGEARSLAILADISEARNDPKAARQYRQESQAIYTQTGAAPRQTERLRSVVSRPNQRPQTRQARPRPPARPPQQPQGTDPRPR